MNSLNKTAGQTAISLDNKTRTFEFNGFNYPIIDMDFSKGMDKEIRNYCLKTLEKGDWCKSAYVRRAFAHNNKRHDGMDVSYMEDDIEVGLLYDGFQDYAWHNMPKKYQKYIDTAYCGCGLFCAICHNYVTFEQITSWFNMNFSKALKINNEYHVNVLKGALRGNTAWC